MKGFKNLSAYASTKSALDGLTKSLAIEFAKDNIRLNIIHLALLRLHIIRVLREIKKNYIIGPYKKLLWVVGEKAEMYHRW